MRVTQCDSLIQSHCYEPKFVCLKGRISSRFVSNRLWIGCQTHLVYPVSDPARQSLSIHALFLVLTITFSYTLSTAREACETAVGLLMFNFILTFMFKFGLSRGFRLKTTQKPHFKSTKFQHFHGLPRVDISVDIVGTKKYKITSLLSYNWLQSIETVIW